MMYARAGRQVILGTFLLAWACAACGSRTDEPSVTVRDSAGIQIVESQRPRWQEDEAWTLSPDPVLEIGVSEGEDPYLLDRVMGVVRFEDGTVVVANRGDNTLRYYDGTGRFLHSAGGSGGGPTEFSQMMGLRRLGDNVVAWQLWVNRSKVFDLQGNLVSAMLAPTQPANILGIFDDGSHLFGVFAPAMPTQAELRLDSTLLYLSTPDFSDADSIARLPAAYVVGIELGDQRIPYPQEYGPIRVVAAGADEWYYGWPEAYEFQVLDRNANVRRIVRRTWDPVPVTDADRQRHRESMLNQPATGGSRRQRPPSAQQRSIVDVMVYPDHHPAFQRIYPDPSGHVWVELPNPEHPAPGSSVPTTWDVFDPSGAWLGSVEFPARFFVFEIGEGYVAGVWKDEVDVERVRVYELVKP